MDTLANNNLITGTVMLETMWETRRMDLLDLISPFVFYAAAKVCAPKEAVDLEKTLAVIKKEFGYVDMPVTVIERVLKRNPRLFRREHGVYYLNKRLDDTVAAIECICRSPRAECTAF